MQHLFLNLAKCSCTDCESSCEKTEEIIQPTISNDDILGVKRIYFITGLIYLLWFVFVIIFTILYIMCVKNKKSESSVLKH